MHGGGRRAGYLYGYGQPSPYPTPHGTGHPSGYPQDYSHSSPTSDSQRTAKLRDRNAGDKDPMTTMNPTAPAPTHLDLEGDLGTETTLIIITMVEAMVAIMAAALTRVLQRRDSQDTTPNSLS